MRNMSIIGQKMKEELAVQVVDMLYVYVILIID